MTTVPMPSSRGLTWFQALTGANGIVVDAPRTVRVADAPLGAEITRFIAVCPDPENRFPRARHGEVGLDEAWTLALQVRQTITTDRGQLPRPIVAIVDVSSQAYGRLEELLGLHLACAAAADAYAVARLAGHPVVALIVGKAMSGAFLAHGYQANRLIALDDSGVAVHAMGKSAAARILRCSVDDLELSATHCPPMAHDIRTYAEWGLLHALIHGVNADAPATWDVDLVRDSLVSAVRDARRGPRDLSCRLARGATHGRAASREVRQRLAAQWDGD